VSGGIIGDLTGDVTGDTSGSSGSTTGNAATATALATARAINGVNFDGSAAITVTADANTLSNTTLKSTVVSSSLTSVGTLTGLTLSGTLNSSHISANNNSNVLWECHDSQSNSRSWGFANDIVAYGDFILKRSDARDNTLDTTVLSFDGSSNATLTGHVGIGVAPDTTNNQLHVKGIASGHDGGITIDRDGGKATWRQSGGTTEGTTIENLVQDAPIRFRVNDGGTAGNVLVLSGSDKSATFSGTINANGGFSRRLDQSGGTSMELRNNSTATDHYAEMYIGDSVSQIVMGYSNNYSSGQWQGAWVYAGSGNLMLKSGDANVEIFAGGNDDSDRALILDTSLNATFAGNIAVTKANAKITVTSGTNESASLRLVNDAQDWDLNTQTNDNFAIYSQTGSAAALSITPALNATFAAEVLAGNHITAAKAGGNDRGQARLSVGNGWAMVELGEAGGAYWGIGPHSPGSYGITSECQFAYMDGSSWTAGIFKVATGGNITGTHGSYHTSSDETLKKNISTISSGLDKVNAMRGVQFKWKKEHDPFPEEEHPNHQMVNLGFIAQELEDIVPEVVNTNSDTGLKAVLDANQLTAVLVEAIKELSAKVEALENA
jgi:hypothetical protein